MSAQTFLDGRVTLYAGDCIDVMATLPANSVDSVVCDPPYHLTSIVKRFSSVSELDVAVASKTPHRRTSAGFMGKQWDGGDIAFRAETWAAVYRVMKPGAHLLAFSGTRTYHRMVCAIEDAGFEIRDQIAWIYGSGFPKSHDVSKAIDRAAGAERQIIGQGSPVKRMIPGADQNKAGWEKNNGREFVPTETAAATDAARQWQGWGSALKPAFEPIVLARKPLIGTIAANVLAHGTGALNINGSRIEARDGVPSFIRRNESVRNVFGDGLNGSNRTGEIDTTTGRWPANIIHDGSEEVLEAFPKTDGGGDIHRRSAPKNSGVYGAFAGDDDRWVGYGDSGSAARFFYTAKADAEDRIGSKHPTVKPLDLMQYLCRLITPPGGTVLDPFAGTGTTGEAAWREGFKAILIEREAEYQAEIVRRMDLVTMPTKRAAVAKSKNKLRGAEGSPLFPGESAA